MTSKELRRLAAAPAAALLASLGAHGAWAGTVSSTSQGPVYLYSGSQRLHSYSDLAGCETGARSAAETAQASGQYTCRTTWTVKVTYTADAPAPPPPPPSGTAHLSWNAPTTNTDGSALTDLAGYYVYRGNSAASLARYVEIDGTSMQSYDDSNLPAGTWVYAVSAFNSAGGESAQSATASKTIQ